MPNVNFVAIDLETATTFRGSICEIGIAVVEEGKIVTSKSWLVQPEDNDYDDFNIEIHGITPEMTENAPSFKEIWNEVLPYIENKLLVAHNTSFDMYAIKDALDRSGIGLPSFDYFCSLRITRKAFPGLYSYSLPLLCGAMQIPFSLHHRAEGDAIGCAQVFLKVLDVLDINDPYVLEDTLAIRKGRFSSEGHFPQRQKSTSHSDYKNILKDLVVDESKINPDSYFFGKSICFTGAFSFGARKDLLQAIADVGGIPTNSVTKSTNILVVGQQDFRVVGDSGMSSKQKKAIELIDKGQDLEIMSEADFLSNFGDAIPNFTKNI